MPRRLGFDFSRLLLRGLWLGAAWGSLAGAIDALWVLGQHPFERDFGLLLRAWPLAVVWGAVVGLAAAAVLPLLTQSREWRGLAGFPLFLVLAGAAAAIGLWRAFPNWHPGARFAAAAAGGLALQQLGRLLIRTPAAWMLGSLFTSLSGGVILALTLLLGFAGALTPVLPGPWTRRMEAGPDVESLPPHLLVVTLRGVGAGHLGGFGYYRPTSPRLDELLHEGLAYPSAFAASPDAERARLALLGLPPRTNPTAAEPEPLPERLRRAGYQVAGLGAGQRATDLDGMPLGFTHYCDPADLELPARLALNRLWRRRFPLATAAGPASRTVTRTQAWLRRERKESRPFALFVDLDQALPPYDPPPDSRDRFLPATTESSEAETAASRLDRDKALFDAEVYLQDRALGDLLDGLADLDLLEQTLVVVVADIGSCFHPEHSEPMHPAGLDCLTRVPLILRWPARLPAGSSFSSGVSGLDLAPTVANLLGLPTSPAGPPGLPLPDAETPASPTAVPIFDPETGDRVWCTEAWKFLETADGALSCRDRTTDPNDASPFTPAGPAERRIAASILAAAEAQSNGPGSG